MNAYDPGLMDACGQGQTYGYDYTYYQDHTDAYNPGQTDGYGLSYVVAHHRGQAGARNQDQMGAYNQNSMSNYYQDHTDAYNPGQTGTYGQGQIDTHHQCEIDSHQPRYIKPIRTKANQLPDREQVHDGSQSAMSYHAAFRNLKAQKATSFLDTSRITTVNLPKNPRSRSKRKEK